MTTKRPRGRPKKEKVKAELPEFKSERDIRRYLLQCGLELSLELKEQALKKNNIKKPAFTNAKNNQYKTALDCLKVIDKLLANLQLDILEEKIELMNEGLLNSSPVNRESLFDEYEIPAETMEKIQALQQLQNELEEYN